MDSNVRAATPASPRPSPPGAENGQELTAIAHTFEAKLLFCTKEHAIAARTLPASRKMNIPKTSDDLKNEFYSSIDLIDKIGDLRIRQLTEKLNKVSDEIIVMGIIKIFENTNRQESQYTDQKYAGKILTELKPRTEIDLNLILKSTLANWNKSVEEFPLWLKENYGIDLLKIKLTELETLDLTQLESDKLKTIKWWLKI
ncbi:hypothetical protein J8281_12715 [Aquimarina sp. U1-2]|uniref:hypothetical protein n=1 Tax=Aquimarina sp. U1-2 TaxID=2823141 RepID=UPI001AED1101|nr:hypothetical protein [Aquimarina sp. U1-2]MBP2833051.1 hypothetical protein [Aquimarina sp. U1-2]